MKKVYDAIKTANKLKDSLNQFSSLTVINTGQRLFILTEEQLKLLGVVL